MSDNKLKSVQKKESRARQKERYHRSAFIGEYIEKKYNNIYKEANQFYEKLYKRYPNKTKLSTCPEFKSWEIDIKKTEGTIQPTDRTNITDHNRQETNNPDLSSINNMEINIQLMDASDVQEVRDIQMFENIQPSLLNEVNPETLNEIIADLQKSEVTSDLFNYIEDEQAMEDICFEIDKAMNELSPLEKELLNY